ncbi:hypothetical protein CJ030_MR1G014058 [Morella rubra]|uniref:Uncharacterized protein n=1 Tax=Morella rubra TaxID=262757 RepID=A0A6A1WPG9_9ROSI|nr:hypothetical protein CJ030_MR1G014058 [Morella rubra]
MALKSNIVDHEKEEEDEGSNDEDIALIKRNFKSFLKKKQGEEGLQEGLVQRREKGVNYMLQCKKSRLI